MWYKVRMFLCAKNFIMKKKRRDSWQFFAFVLNNNTRSIVTMNLFRELMIRKSFKKKITYESFEFEKLKTHQPIIYSRCESK